MTACDSKLFLKQSVALYVPFWACCIFVTMVAGCSSPAMVTTTAGISIPEQPKQEDIDINVLKSKRDKILTEYQQTNAELRKKTPVECAACASTPSENMDSDGYAMRAEDAERTALEKRKGLLEQAYRAVDHQYSVELTKTIPYFPLPPPKASDTEIIPLRLLFKIIPTQLELKNVEEVLSRTLDLAGYSEKRYYAVPKGFAMVTRLERINNDGSPLEPRWTKGWEPPTDLWGALKALFIAEPGRHRVIVFIVTPVPFNQTNEKMTAEDMENWLTVGLNKLPDTVGENKVNSSELTCTALIYEFVQPATQHLASIRIPGDISARTHLIKARIFNETSWSN